MTKTYTIATANEMMIAIVPDGQDIDAEVARVAEEAGVTFEQYDTITGLILIDDPTHFDTIVVHGDKMGRLTDEDGIGYLYAVKRRARGDGSRRADVELDANFGGRAAYLAMLREDLQATRDRLAAGFAADNARMSPEDIAIFDSFFGPESEARWTEQREGVIRQLEITLAANT